MKITYDKHTDTLVMTLRAGAAIAESEEVRPGIIADYGDDGRLVSLEILDASRNVTEADRVDFQLAR